MDTMFIHLYSRLGFEKWSEMRNSKRGTLGKNPPLHCLRISSIYGIIYAVRFSEISGKLNPDIFLKTFEFLDQYQEDEVKKLTKGVKKVKNEEKLASMSTELQRWAHLLS